LRHGFAESFHFVDTARTVPAARSIPGPQREGTVMKRTVYSVVRRRKAWHVCSEGRNEPLAIYIRRDDALRYAQEAARQRNEIYGDSAVVSAPPAPSVQRRRGHVVLEIVR
jgi:hypothetical protein